MDSGSKAACLASAPVYDTCAANPDDQAAAEQAARPFNTKFGFLSNIFQMGNIYKSNYNGLQTTLTARNYHGFSAVAGYTYSHALDNVGANWHFGYGAGLPMDSYNTGREYATSDFDMRHRLTLSLTYVIPGKKSFAQMLEGWQLTSIVTSTARNPGASLTWERTSPEREPLPVSPPANSPNRWDFFGNPNAFTSGSTPIPFFGGASNASLRRQGARHGRRVTRSGDCRAQRVWAATQRAVRCCFRRPSERSARWGATRSRIPASATGISRSQKKWKFTERFSAQFRAEFFNVLNHPNFANPYGGQNGFGLNDPSAGGFGCGCVTPDVAAANPVIGSGGARAVQLGLKLLF